MRFFCLTQVEYSLVGSVQTESSRMSPLHSDRGSSFSINYSRTMGAFTFLAFVQPQSFRGDFYFSWRGMKFYSDSCFGGNVCRLFAKFWIRLLRTFVYGFCAHIRLWFCARCAAFAYVYGFCARWAAFAYVYGLSSRCSVQTVSRYPILQVLPFILSALADCDYWTVSRIRSWGFR